MALYKVDQVRLQILHCGPWHIPAGCQMLEGRKVCRLSTQLNERATNTTLRLTFRFLVHIRDNLPSVIPGAFKAEIKRFIKIRSYSIAGQHNE